MDERYEKEISLAIPGMKSNAVGRYAVGRYAEVRKECRAADNNSGDACPIQTNNFLKKQ